MNPGRGGASPLLRGAVSTVPFRTPEPFHDIPRREPCHSGRWAPRIQTTPYVFINMKPSHTSTFIRQTPGSPRARRRAGGGDSGVSRTDGPALSELVVQWGDRQSGTQRQTDDPAQQCRGGAESSAGGTARVTWAAGRAPPLGAAGTDHRSMGWKV